MDERAALHTAARRYCLERAPGLDPHHEEQWYRDRHWTQDGELVRVWSETRGTGAQLDVLGAILFRVEQIAPEDFSSTDALRTFLIELSHHAFHPLDGPGNAFLFPPVAAFEQEQIAERALFQRYLEGLSVDDLQAIAPLPARRVLGQRKQEKIWQRLKRRWGLTPWLHWYPLQGGPLPPHVVAFQEDWFARYVLPDVLRQILRQRRIRRVWELREAGMFPQYEMDLALLIPWGDGGEHCWTSEKMDWLLYTSHESSVTLGGDWFLNLVKQAWPQWEEHLYTGYMYQRPPLEPLER